MSTRLYKNLKLVKHSHNTPQVDVYSFPATPMRFLLPGKRKADSILKVVRQLGGGIVVLVFGFVDLNFSYFKHHHHDPAGRQLLTFMSARIAHLVKFCDLLTRTNPSINVCVQEISSNCIRWPHTNARRTLKELISSQDEGGAGRHDTDSCGVADSRRHIVCLACMVVEEEGVEWVGDVEGTS